MQSGAEWRSVRFTVTRPLQYNAAVQCCYHVLHLHPSCYCAARNRTNLCSRSVYTTSAQPCCAPQLRLLTTLHPSIRLSLQHFCSSVERLASRLSMVAASALARIQPIGSATGTRLSPVVQLTSLLHAHTLSSVRSIHHSTAAGSSSRSCGRARRCLHWSVRQSTVASLAPAGGAAASSVMLDDAKYIVGTYARQPFEFVSGRGSTLVDAAGRSYIDFYSGIAVNALGHSHPLWVEAVRQQADKSEEDNATGTPGPRLGRTGADSTCV